MTAKGGHNVPNGTTQIAQGIRQNRGTGNFDHGMNVYTGVGHLGVDCSVDYIGIV